jgi:CheY-like chemotaxis protein
MIVDDTYFNIVIMKDVMKQLFKIDIENDVVEAYNGKEAIIKYITLHKEFKVCPIEIIFMDCEMPILNGFRATEYILKYAKDQIS